MPVNFTIDIRVDPFVKKWMDARFKCVRGVYQLGDSCYYGLVSAMLCQSQRVGSPTVVPDKYASFRNIKVGITEYDFYHYGWEVSVAQELRFSRLVRSIAVDECLRSVAILRARYEIPVSQAINSYCIYYNLEEEDIKFETLRKIYRRKYQHVEEDYRKLDIAAVTDFGARPSAVPVHKTLCLHHRHAVDPSQLSLFSKD